MHEETADPYLLVGLGNPGNSYQDTRHNIGFQIAIAFAKQHELIFRKDATLQGEVAKGALRGSGDKVIVLMPLTFVNLSGQAVKACVRYFRTRLDRLLVVSDEVALPFGKLRLSERGSAGGHNGLKSIEEHLGTQYYARLRFGVGDREHGELVDHVLGKFKEEEKRRLPALIEQAAQVIYIWITQGGEPAKRACAPIDHKES
jgi:peptidyl-tRNA hydrolase, PTH1 family